MMDNWAHSWRYFWNLFGIMKVMWGKWFFLLTAFSFFFSFVRSILDGKHILVDGGASSYTS